MDRKGQRDWAPDGRRWVQHGKKDRYELLKKTEQMEHGGRRPPRPPIWNGIVRISEGNEAEGTNPTPVAS